MRSREEPPPIEQIARRHRGSHTASDRDVATPVGPVQSRVRRSDHPFGLRRHIDHGTAITIVCGSPTRLGTSAVPLATTWSLTAKRVDVLVALVDKTSVPRITIPGSSSSCGTERRPTTSPSTIVTVTHVALGQPPAGGVGLPSRASTASHPCGRRHRKHDRTGVGGDATWAISPASRTSKIASRSYSARMAPRRTRTRSLAGAGPWSPESGHRI